jgi:preprotein translocase subunit SecY|tara:strand:- start:7488 stop:8675 length:1188 start_codon:yes stop_codon:yes gene_type:complete
MSILTKKIYITLSLIFIIRMGNFIPIPNVNQSQLVNLLNSNYSLKAFFNGENIVLSLFSLGILPSINASILMQLLVNLIPNLAYSQKEEGASGRTRIKQYTRYLTFLIAILQSLSITLSIRSILFNWNLGICFQMTLALTTGSMLVLWLSDLITENGIGNGSSLVITLNILSTLPNTLKTIIISTNNFNFLANFLSFTSLIIGIIYLQEAVKVIPLISAKQLMQFENKKQKRIRSNSYLPLKLNQGGVMPIIFSSTVLTIFTVVSNYLLNIFPNLSIVNNSTIMSLLYGVINFSLIVGFSLFYSTLIINPKELAKELNKMTIGIPKIRPGKQTEIYLKKTITRLGLLGAIFLGILVTIPNIRSSYGFGITSLLILVGVTFDIARQIQALLLSEIY